MTSSSEQKGLTERVKALVGKVDLKGIQYFEVSAKSDADDRFDAPTASEVNAEPAFSLQLS